MSSAPLRLLFAGTPDFAAFHLKALIESKHQLIGAYTQPDRPAGRGKKLQPSAVKTLAQEAGLPVFQPVSLKDSEAQAELAALEADVLVVVAYGLILPAAVLAAPRLGCLNIHASVLPRWRGAAPIARAIEAGDAASGVTIMQMDEGLDTGDILAIEECPITPTTTAASLHDTLADSGPDLLLRVLDDLEAYQARRRPQPDEGVTYASKISKAEAALDWTLPAAQLDARVRAFNPFPVCFSHLDTERVRIWQATPQALPGTPKTPGTIVRADEHGILVACGEGGLLIERLQLAGGKQLDAADLLRSRGSLFAPGARFTLPDTAEPQ